MKKERVENNPRLLFVIESSKEGEKRSVNVCVCTRVCVVVPLCVSMWRLGFDTRCLPQLFFMYFSFIIYFSKGEIKLYLFTVCMCAHVCMCHGVCMCVCV